MLIPKMLVQIWFSVTISERKPIALFFFSKTIILYKSKISYLLKVLFLLLRVGIIKAHDELALEIELVVLVE